MPYTGPMIAASARQGLVYAERLFQGISAEQFGQFARVGGTVIDSNHPAFVCGHLSLYASKIIHEVGCDSAAYAPAPSYLQLFSKDATCVDDPDASIYPPMGELTSALVDGYTAVIGALESAEDHLFLAENPTEASRGRFPTKGAMHTFYVGGHFMLHMGQLSAWRRAMGLGPA